MKSSGNERAAEVNQILKVIDMANKMILFYYASSDQNTFNTYLSLEIAEDYIKERFRFKDENYRLYMRSPINSPSERPNLKYEYKGYKSPDKGWAVSKEVMEQMDKEGRLYFPPNKNQRIYRKIFLDEYKGQPIQNLWIDIPFINPMARERLGYPTQKPESLMERIIKSSSNEGDLVVDFFCGCGTTIAAAEKLDRKWLGVDISHLAIKLITKRLIATYGPQIRKTFEIYGFPRDLASARELATGANGGRLKFEEWIIEIMLHGVLNPRRTETGYDGYMTFDVQGAKSTVLIEVKSGNTNLTQLNHFIKTVEDKNTQMGLFICFEDQVTSGMRKSAKQQGYYNQDQFVTMYDKIQIITVEDLLNHKDPNIPKSSEGIFKSAQRETKEKDTQKKIDM